MRSAFKKTRKTYRRKYKTFPRNSYPGRPVLYRDPPNIEVNVAQVKRFRFQCGTNTGTPITISDNDLSRLLLGYVAISTSAVELISSFKIIELEMWIPYNVGTLGAATTNTNAITWTGGGLASDKTVMAVSLSIDRPAYLRTKPPSNSQAAFWALGNGNSNNYFTIQTSPLGGIIDLTLAFKLPVGPTSTTTSVASMTSGLFYGRLDGGSGVWEAVTGVPGANE